MSAAQRAPTLLVDANLLIGAFLKSSHPLLDAAYEGRCALRVCPYVVGEARHMIRRAFGGRLQEFDQFIADLPVEGIPDAREETVAEWSQFVSDRGDAPVLAAAIEAGLEAIVTSDRNFRADARATLALAGDPVRVLSVTQALAFIVRPEE